MGLSKEVDSRRRTLLAALAALIPSRFAFARPIQVVGYLGAADEARALARLMAELGYVEGQDLRFEVRGAPGLQQLPNVAMELIRRQPDALVADGPAVVTLAAFTQTIPIICEGVPDPVAGGLAESLRRPGRNVTGLTTGSSETAGIVFGLLKAMRPRLKRIVVLHSPRAPVAAQMRMHGEAAKAAGLEWILAPVTGADDVERALAPLAGEAAWMAPMPVRGLPEEALAIAIKHKVATVGGYPGNLMWYGREFSDAPRRVAAILDRVLKGTPAGEIPFELPDRQVFVLNRATARAIGVEIPQDVLMRATKVVD